ncbi:MAG: histidine--tRNA ligase [Candidatus Wildermuthbacteria bacterium RIFCSPLOWO2_02_FULL_47_9c]|uniref:Histidine--tRNA ligase n=2 Tax=Parcubacteria group TaxID=1794811 RepID=A0A837IM47_9BACT|nr:MAG: Histidine-tRNA ligase [Candidatus Yanofskybacteria bacterium GW2011_GWC1_48_11]KKW04039.1 MAG: Histidine-tRNA ligase [Parcubacteria group bacterium GW2011_GWB1_49_12]KKW08860.1 MAG: Histidine-tRNA ligase [Parcubacteria group bacterium GW2011_GWA1_49_26]KKW13825.1 MAG: Histidine-tRNA ligase [Parcubacteria group bacterium GW2011_GWA2_50_10]OHA61783.1 MAG: histidine--tRNA ligase [Candidatus Wildermuthbacteria bacterium GWA1_49_26]OHA65610.1 MAG: histidine--tRNA ligase [Candidatus Wildermu
MSKKVKFQTPTGMHDILPEDQFLYEKIWRVVDDVAAFYGFGKIETPLVEDAALFEKGTGGTTDIVEKQMYTLKTRGGDMLALRPEFTPGIVRSYIQHGMIALPQPVKLYAYGPLFRYEHPQAGRFRQFRQVDFEVFGEQSAALDAQIIQIFYVILKELKFSHLIIEVNSIGDNQCRPYYKKLLSGYLRPRQNSLCADCRRRIRENPLRTLDCKEEKCQRVRSQAPQLIDHLCEECKNHFKSLLEFLDETDLPYHLDPYLVRGLDYYTKTVFEIFSEQTMKTTGEGGEVVQRNALVGGGRYDGLVHLLGGKDVPASGAAAGVERIVSFLKEMEFAAAPAPVARIFLAQLGDLSKKKSLRLLEEFRKAKIQIAESLGRDSLRTQLARADKLEVEYTAILGQKEVLDGTIVLRKMDTGEQETLKLEKVVEEIKERLRK